MDFSFHAVVQIGIAVCMGVAMLIANYCIGWKASPAADDTFVRLTYNPPLKFMGWVMLALGFAFPVFMVVVVLLFPPTHLGDTIGAAVFALVVLAAGVGLWREMQLGHVTITPERVELFSPWRGSRSLEWSRIRLAELGPIGWVILSAADGTKLTFRPMYWTGIDRLDKAVRERVASSSIITRTLQ